MIMKSQTQNSAPTIPNSLTNGIAGNHDNMTDIITDSLSDVEQSLLSFENLDRGSPDLWPEPLPGLCQWMPEASPNLSVNHNKPIYNNGIASHSNSPVPPWLQVVEQEFVSAVQHMSTYSPDQITQEVHKLQNAAYQLGLEEAREMTRGKLLNVLERRKKS